MMVFTILYWSGVAAVAVVLSAIAVSALRRANGL